MCTTKTKHSNIKRDFLKRYIQIANYKSFEFSKWWRKMQIEVRKFSKLDVLFVAHFQDLKEKLKNWKPSE